jgi:hypothetical protein
MPPQAIGSFGACSSTSSRVGAIIFVHYTPTGWSVGTKRNFESVGRGKVDGPGGPELTRRFAVLFALCKKENRTWGAPRIHGELLKLGYQVSQATASKCVKRDPKPPSQSWRTFLAHHAEVIAAIDFFTVPTGLSRSCTCSLSSNTVGGASVASM